MHPYGDAAIPNVRSSGPVHLLPVAQKAFPLLVANILPIGVRGIVVAGLLFT